jgi:hypothetical protein
MCHYWRDDLHVSALIAHLTLVSIGLQISVAAYPLSQVSRTMHQEAEAKRNRRQNVSLSSLCLSSRRSVCGI